MVDFRIAGVDLSDRLFNSDQLNGLSIQLQAFDGGVGVGSFLLPDTDGTDDFVGGRQLRIRDINVTLIDGFIGDQNRTRDRLPLTPQRQHTITLRDPNALLYRFITYQVRPEETDRARVLAFFAEYLPAVDTTWVLNTNLVTMPAKTYRDGNGFDSLITDTRELTGKTLWIHDKATGGRCAHYHTVTEGHTAAISISDDPDDVDGITVFAPVKFPNRRHSPAELSNYVVGRSQAGLRSIKFDGTSITAHNADGLYHNQLVEFEAASQAELEDRTEQYLTEHKLEAQTYEVVITGLDATAMGKWRVGDLIDVTSDVLGLPNASSPHRIAHATITPTKDTNGNPLPGLWDCSFELGRPFRAKRPPSGLTNLIKRPVTPFVPGSTILAHDQIGPSTSVTSLPLPSISPAGNTMQLVAFLAVSPFTITPTHANWSHQISHPASGIRYDVWDRYHATDAAPYADTFTASSAVDYHAIVVAFQSADPTALVDKWENTDTYTPPFPDTPSITTTITTTPTRGNLLLAYHSGTADTGGNIVSVAMPAGWTLLETTVGSTNIGPGRVWYKISDGTEASVTATIAGLDIAEQTLLVLEYGEVNVAPVPDYGQKTCEEVTGDGSTGPYTLNYPYLAGSVEAHGKVSGQDWTLDETDPGAGEFETASALGVGQVLVVCYQATGEDGTGEANPQPEPVTPTSASTLDILDEGVSLTTTPTSIDFVGAGVEATATGDAVTVTIPGDSSPHVLNVLDFGALCDDVSGAGTDDAVALQAAIDEAEANQLAGVGPVTVYIPGYTRTSTTLTVQRPITIEGDGGEGAASRIRMSTANTTLFSCNNQGLATFRGLYLLGIDGATSGDGILTTKDCFTDDIRIEKFHSGLHIGSGSFYSRHNRLMAYDNTYAGVRLDNGCNNATFVGGRYQNNAYGFFFSTVHGLRIFGGSIEVNSYGLYSDGGSQAIHVLGTYFESNSTNDIAIGVGSSDKGWMIEGCLFTTGGTVRSIDVIAATDKVTVAGCFFDSANPPSSGDIRTQSASTDITLINNSYSGAGISIAGDAIELNPSDTTTPSPVGDAASRGSSRYIAPIGHVHALGGTVGGDLSGTLPNPTVAKVNGVAVTGTPTSGQVITATSGTAASWQDAAGGVDPEDLVALGVVGPILIADDHSTPIVFADILLTEEGDDILYADIGA